MKDKLFKKEYTALLEGVLENSSGTINVPITRRAGSIIEREVSDLGETAISHYEVIKKYEDYTLVKFLLETGRTHQLRVHSKYIEHPILGDTLYGNGSSLICRQALHASKVSFVHPISKENVSYVSPIPDDIEKLI